jgi:uncharacterized protein YoxC
MLWEYSISAAAAAFIIMAAFIVYTLIEVRLSIQQSRETFRRMELRLEKTADETLGLIHSTQSIIANIDSRLQASDGFIQAFSSAGDSARRLSQTVNGFSRILSEAAAEAQASLHAQHDTIRDIVSLTTAGVQLWQRWQTRKPSRADSKTDEHL